jgi:hypothetical protein
MQLVGRHTQADPGPLGVGPRCTTYTQIPPGYTQYLALLPMYTQPPALVLVRLLGAPPCVVQASYLEGVGVRIWKENEVAPAKP